MTSTMYSWHCGAGIPHDLLFRALVILCMTLMVKSRQLGGGSSLRSMTLSHSRSKCFFFESSAGVFDHLYVDTSRVGKFALCLLMASSSFLHREGRHREWRRRVLWLVVTVLVVFVPSSLRCGDPLRTPRTFFLMPCLSYLLVPVLSCMCVCVMRTFLRLFVGGSAVFWTAEVARDVGDVLSSFVVFYRTYRFLDSFVIVCLCLSVIIWC